jgi:hypothetical protein
MSSDNSNAQPVSTSIPKPSGMAFVTHFVPGLVTGLLVGALATAFITPLLERNDIKLPHGTPATAGAPAGSQSNEDQSAAPAEGAAGAKPAEAVPAEATPKPDAAKPVEGEKPADAPKPAP